MNEVLALVAGTDIKAGDERLVLSHNPKTGAGRLTTEKQKDWVLKAIRANTEAIKADPSVAVLTPSAAKRAFQVYRLGTAEAVTNRIAQRMLKGDLVVDVANIRKDGSVGSVRFIKPSVTQENQDKEAIARLLDRGFLSEEQVAKIIADRKAELAAAKKSIIDVGGQTSPVNPPAQDGNGQPVAAAA